MRQNRRVPSPQPPDPTVRRVVVLGSTGSIGVQALDVVRAAPERFEVVALAAGGSDPKTLAAQAAEFHVPVVGVAHQEAVAPLREALERSGADPLPEVVAGPTPPPSSRGLPPTSS